jgi:hypothetical protein
LLRTAVSVPGIAPDIVGVSESSTFSGSGSLTLALLAAGVPLSLLIDLTTPGGPDSAGIYAGEPLP